MFNPSKCPRCGARINMQTRDEARQHYANAFAPWTPEDDAKLARMVAEGANRLTLSQALERQVGSIIRRIEKLGLRENPRVLSEVQAAVEKSFDEQELKAHFPEGGSVLPLGEEPHVE